MKKEITMKKYLCGADGWREAAPVKMIRVSRWITVKQNYTPRKNNSLWDYVTDENGRGPYSDKFDPAGGLFLDYFTFNGRNYAINQFLTLGNPLHMPFTLAYENESGALCYLSGVDGDNYFDPLYIECDECMERVRVYMEA